MWVVCSVCGTIVAELAVHRDWHESKGDALPVDPNAPVDDEESEPA